MISLNRLALPSRPRMVTLLLVVMLMATVAQAGGEQLELSIEPSLQLNLVDQETRQSSTSIKVPPEGLWSIGNGWHEEWPQEWSHADPETIAEVGPWTILTGTVNTADGPWIMRDAWRLVGQDCVECKRRWEYQGEKPSGPTVLSVRLQVDRMQPDSELPLRPFLPGINYFGNPSGTRIDPSRVPTWTGNLSNWTDLRVESHRRFPYELVFDLNPYPSAIRSL